MGMPNYTKHATNFL